MTFDGKNVMRSQPQITDGFRSPNLRKFYMKTLIAYQTFLGSTSKYAEWLHGRIEADVMKLRDVREDELANYDQIIVMSGTYAGQMPMIKFLTQHWSTLQNKRIVAIAVGAAPADDEQSKKSYELIPEEIRRKIKYYKIPGRLFGINKDKVKEDNLEEVLREIKS